MAISPANFFSQELDTNSRDSHQDIKDLRCFGCYGIKWVNPHMTAVTTDVLSGI